MSTRLRFEGWEVAGDRPNILFRTSRDATLYCIYEEMNREWRRRREGEEGKGNKGRKREERGDGRSKEEKKMYNDRTNYLVLIEPDRNNDVHTSDRPPCCTAHIFLLFLIFFFYKYRAILKNYAKQQTLRFHVRPVLL